MKKYLYILLLLSLLLEAKTFNTIKFKGDIDLITGEFDRSTLLKICHIEYPAIYQVWKSDPTFDEEEIEDCVKSLVDYSHSMGYYKAKVKATTKGDTVYIEIKKNESIKVATLALADEFRRFTPLRVGKRFRTVDFTSTKKSITSYLEENGYPTYKMNAKAFVDLDEYKVDVKIEVDKGKKRFFGETDINNSSDVDNELILEELVYEKGELYNVLKLEESYENIYRLGVFEKIKMEGDFNSSEDLAPIHLELKQGKTKEFSSHLGYDTEEGARGGLEYVDHNFFGNLREFKVGAKISERGYVGYTDFYDPKVTLPLIGRVNFRNELNYRKWDYDSYVEKLLTERVTFGKSLIGIDHFFGFQHENSIIESGNPTFMAGNYNINSLFYRWIIDERNSAMNATDGYYASIYIEKSMKQLGSDIDYLKALGELRYIKKFDEIVYATKLKAGTISEKTPPFKHFFLGGAMSNRGYEYRDLGRHSSHYPVGGLSMIDASFEARYGLTENLSVVGFLDGSKLSEEIDDFSGEWYLSVGSGIRYLSVIGPLRLDVGFPTKGGFALHLGIGQVF